MKAIFPKWNRANSLFRNGASSMVLGSSGSVIRVSESALQWSEGGGQAALLRPVRGETSCSVRPWCFSSCFNTWFNTWFAWVPVVTRATDINTDPNYGKTTDPDMALSSSFGLDITMDLGGSI